MPHITIEMTPEELQAAINAELQLLREDIFAELNEQIHSCFLQELDTQRNNMYAALETQQNNNYAALKADIQGALRADTDAFRQSSQATQAKLQKQVNQQLTQIKGEMYHKIERVRDDMVKEMQAHFTQWKSLLETSI